MNSKTLTPKLTLSLLVATIALGLASGCSSARRDERNPPIENPFADYYQGGKTPRQPVVLRSKKGDRAFELELPSTDTGMADYIVPMNPTFKDASRRGLASVDDSSTNFAQSKPTFADREITAKFAKVTPDEHNRQSALEDQMGLMSPENSAPEQDSSYLGQMDEVKQSYRNNRFEAALIQIDKMIRQYPTDPKAYAMRGTILERLGHNDLALKSWTQSLDFDPSNESLRKFIERKKQTQSRRLASP